MNCDRAKEQLVLLQYEEIAEAERVDLLLHLHTCPECEAEEAAWETFRTRMLDEVFLPVSPNLLASARMRLDEALDAAGGSTWPMRLRAGLVGVWQHLYAAPALATLLVGVGFLGGNLLTRYQVAHAPPAQGSGSSFNESASVIGTVNGILPTSDPQVVQVKYTRIVPSTFQGRIDEPAVRQLLMFAAQRGSDIGVRSMGVGYLAQECKAGHRCEHATAGEGTGFRDALLVSLRYDKSPAVRLQALEGLQKFIGEDQRVRDAVLEAIMRDPSAEVRKHAIGALSPVEGDSSVRQVLQTVSTQDENPYIRTVSLEALGHVDGIE